MSEQSNDDDVVRTLLVQLLSDPYVGPLALDVDNSTVALQLLKPGGPRPSDDGDIVMPGASQLEGNSATDLPYTKDGDTQRRGPLHC